MVFAIAVSTFAGTKVGSGKTFTAMGDYKIETADKPYVLDGRELKTFVISYENSPMKVTVAVDKGKDCNTYLVLSDKLSVQYVCNEAYFGVEKIAREYNKHGLKTSDDDLNRLEYFHQKVLSREVNAPVENAKLIAAYFPALVKDLNGILATR